MVVDRLILGMLRLPCPLRASLNLWRFLKVIDKIRLERYRKTVIKDAKAVIQYYEEYGLGENLDESLINIEIDLLRTLKITARLTQSLIASEIL